MLAMGIASSNVEVNRQWTEINRERRTELAPPMIFCVFSDTVTQKMGGGITLKSDRGNLFSIESYATEFLTSDRTI